MTLDELVEFLEDQQAQGNGYLDVAVNPISPDHVVDHLEARISKGDYLLITT